MLFLRQTCDRVGALGALLLGLSRTGLWPLCLAASCAVKRGDSSLAHVDSDLAKPVLDLGGMDRGPIPIEQR